MKVRDVMTRDVLTLRPEASLKEVARVLSGRGISGAPVVDEKGNLLGVVSEADVLAKEKGPGVREGRVSRMLHARPASEQAKAAASTTAEAMTAPAKTIAPWRSVAGAAEMMLEHEVNRLPVVDNAGRLVGIVTRADLVRAFARPDADLEHEIREDVLRGAMVLRDPYALDVHVAEGRVAISGVVDSRMDAESLAAAVARIPGVVDVDCTLACRTSGVEDG